MRWSDDKLKSNYHRVRMPMPGEDQGSRYSIAYFNQARALCACKACSLERQCSGFAALAVARGVGTSASVKFHVPPDSGFKDHSLCSELQALNY